MNAMKGVVFMGTDRLAGEERPRPTPKDGEAVIRMTHTAICGTDVHLVRGEHPVRTGLILGHEPVGVIEAVGGGLKQDYVVGQQVIVGAITPCGQCFYCLRGTHSRCDGALGGWRFGNTIEGAPAEYLVIPDARANLAVIPEALTDEDVLFGADIFSTSFSGAKSANIKSGDSVAVFTQGPIGLCATVGAKLRGASLVIGIDSIPERLEAAKRLGADVTLNIKAGDPVPEIKRLTGGLGVDVAIDALGQQETFESALRATRPGGTLSSVGQYSGNVIPPCDASYASERIVARLCPGGKEHMRRLMAMVEHHRVDLFPLVTHSFALDDIEDSYDVFSIRTWRVGQPSDVGSGERSRR